MEGLWSWMKTGVWAPKANSNSFISAASTVDCTVCEHEICQWIIQGTAGSAAVSGFVPHWSTFPSWQPEPSLGPCSRRPSFQLVISYRPDLTGNTDKEETLDIMTHCFLFFFKAMVTAGVKWWSFIIVTWWTTNLFKEASACIKKVCPLPMRDTVMFYSLIILIPT